MRTLATAPDNEYFVHVDIDLNSVLKKVKIYEMYIVDSNGKVVYDMVGGTIGFYSGRLTRAKIKAMVKSFIDEELDLGEKVNIPLSNISVKNEQQMDQVRDRSDYELYQAFKKNRSGILP